MITVQTKKGSPVEFSEISPSQYLATIKIPSSFVDSIYENAIKSQKTSAIIYGFSQGNIPAVYIESTFKLPILDYIKSILLSFYVEDKLLKSLYENEIGLTDDYHLTKLDLHQGQEALFQFSITSLKPIAKKNWQEIFIKAPTRKNYKDLDRQVEGFIKEEIQNQSQSNNKISLLDFVCFDLAITDENKKNILGNYKQTLWLKIGDEEADHDLSQIFLNKKVGDVIFTQSKRLQMLISDETEILNNFLITIKDVVPFKYFNFEQFKKHFEIKSLKEMESKLIEIFSYRNNLSQRRETVELILNALSKNFSIDIPQNILMQHKKKLMAEIQENPDYWVYKAQPDFNHKVNLLVKKQLKEIIIIDALSHAQKINVSHEEIVNYINLLKRSRTKDYVYFIIPPTKINGLEAPISNEHIKRYCIREKTLNYVINFLTKK